MATLSLACLGPQDTNGPGLWPGYGGQKWPPKCLGSNPQNLHHMVKEDFADVIKIRVWRWGDYPGFSRSSQERQKGQSQQEGM